MSSGLGEVRTRINDSPAGVVGRGKWFCHTFRDAGRLGVVLWVCGS
jgi:hypothetical protein